MMNIRLRALGIAAVMAIATLAAVAVGGPAKAEAGGGSQPVCPANQTAKAPNDAVLAWEYRAKPIAGAAIAANKDYLALVTIDGQATTHSRVRWVTDPDISSKNTAVLSEDSGVEVTVTHALEYFGTSEWPGNYEDNHRIKYRSFDSETLTSHDLVVQPPGTGSAAVSGTQSVWAGDDSRQYLEAAPSGTDNVNIRVAHVKVLGDHATEAELKSAVKSASSASGVFWVTVAHDATAVEVLDALDPLTHHEVDSGSRYIDARDSANVAVGNFNAGKRTYWMIGGLVTKRVTHVKIDGARDSEQAVRDANKTSTGSGVHGVLISPDATLLNILDVANGKSHHSITSRSRYIDARDAGNVAVGNFKSGKATYWLVE